MSLPQLQKKPLNARGLLLGYLPTTDQNKANLCPLYPRKRTCAVQLGMSALGHKRTFELPV